MSQCPIAPEKANQLQTYHEKKVARFSSTFSHIGSLVSGVFTAKFVPYLPILMLFLHSRTG